MTLPAWIYPPEGGTYYPCNFVINGQPIIHLLISNHYKKKHAKYMSDELIKKLIKIYLDGTNKRTYQGKKNGPWEYFVKQPLLYEEKKYRLVWLSHQDFPNLLGIVNCCYSDKKLIINDHE